MPMNQVCIQLVNACWQIISSTDETRLGYCGNVRKGSLVIDENETASLFPPQMPTKCFYKWFQTQTVMFSLLDSNKYFGFYGLNPELIIQWGCLWAPAQDQSLVYCTFVHTVCKKMTGTPQSWSVTMSCRLSSRREGKLQQALTFSSISSSDLFSQLPPHCREHHGWASKAWLKDGGQSRNYSLAS